MNQEQMYVEHIKGSYVMSHAGERYCTVRILAHRTDNGTRWRAVARDIPTTTPNVPVVDLPREATHEHLDTAVAQAARLLVYGTDTPTAVQRVWLRTRPFRLPGFDKSNYWEEMDHLTHLVLIGARDRLKRTGWTATGPASTHLGEAVRTRAQALSDDTPRARQDLAMDRLGLQAHYRKHVPDDVIDLVRERIEAHAGETLGHWLLAPQRSHQDVITVLDDAARPLRQDPVYFDPGTYLETQPDGAADRQQTVCPEDAEQEPDASTTDR